MDHLGDSIHTVFTPPLTDDSVLGLNLDHGHP
jgi:hypothetical protein